MTSAARTTCREIRQRLPQYVRGEMSPADQSRWAEHLETCPECRNEEAWERRMQALLKVPPQPSLPEPGNLAERIRINVPRLIVRRRRRRQIVWANAVATVILVLGAAWWRGAPSSVDWEDYQRLALETQQELYWTRQPELKISYQQLNTETFKDSFFDYGLSRNRRRRYQEAAQRLEGALRRQPQNGRGWMLLGTFSLGLNQTQTGLQALQRALDIDPALAEAYRLRSEAYRRARRFDKALDAATRAIARTPEKALPYCQRAAVWSGLGKYERALQDLQKAETLDPELLEVHLGKGLVYLETGRHTLAIEAFEKVLDLDPTYLRARILLGVAYNLEGYETEAITAAQEVLQSDPSHPLAHLLLAWIYEDKGQQEEAMVAYQQVLTTNPGQEYAAYRLGRQYSILDRPEEAREAFAALVQDAPEAYMLHLQSGLAYHRIGRFPEALSEIRKALQEHPRSAYARIHLASTLYAAGEPQEAFKVLAEAAQNYPQDAQVFEELYCLLRQASFPTDPAYQAAQAALARQRGARTQRFLNTVAQMVQEQGGGEAALSQLDRAWWFLHQGDVIRAEQSGIAVCEQYQLGVSVTLGPQNQESGLRQLELGDRDGGTEAEAYLGGRTARWTQVDSGQRYIYFDVLGKPSPTHGAWVVVEYWDAPDNGIKIDYDSTDINSLYQGVYKWTEDAAKGNTETWQRYVFWLPDAAFRGRQKEVADFRIHSRGWRDTAIHSVRVLIP